jgi:hypothetical protein
MFEIFYQQGNKDSLMTLCKKLMKVNKASDAKVEKEKGAK